MECFCGGKIKNRKCSRCKTEFVGMRSVVSAEKKRKRESSLPAISRGHMTKLRQIEMKTIISTGVKRMGRKK